MGELWILVLSLTGWVFAASAAAKLSSRRAYRAFRDGLAESRLFPARLVPAVAASLAAAEAVLAGGLLAAAGLTTVAAPGAAWLAESALAVAAVLTAGLAVGVALVVRRGTRARCACFGARSARPLGRVHLARNLCLLAVVGAGLAGIPVARGHAGSAGAALAAVAGAVTALMFIYWDDLAGLFRPITAPPAPVPAGRRLADGSK
jgi:hypothetical protein